MSIRTFPTKELSKNKTEINFDLLIFVFNQLMILFADMCRHLNLRCFLINHFDPHHTKIFLFNPLSMISMYWIQYKFLNKKYLTLNKIHIFVLK